MFTLDNTFFTYINQSSNENLKERINDKKEFSEKEYQNKIKQIKTIIKNKGAGFKTINRQSSDYVLANLSAIYIALVTGRRMYEIFKTLDIVKNGKTTFFIGLLKKDDEKKDDKYKAYLLDDDFKFIKLCLKTVRGYYEEVLKDFDNRRFNNSYRGSINKFLKQVMADDETINNVTYATLRDMYTDIAIKKFKPDNMDDELFRNVVLSHELEDIKLGLSASYRKTKSK
jgi:deoxyxylulose-5-phosphate synthase